MDQKSARIAEFIGAVQKAAEVATDYWLLDAEKDPGKSEALAVRILGYQTLLDGMRSDVLERIGMIDKIALRHSLSEFHQAMTGGDFMGKSKGASVEQARDVQHFAARLIAEIHRGRARKLKLLK